jgi:hypothetical protein
MQTMNYTGVLEIQACWCGIVHAVPKEMCDTQREQLANGTKLTAIHCPVGHQWFFRGESRVDALERDLARERARHDQTRAALSETRNERDHNERKLIATKGVVTRIKNRVAKGVCPCCKRHFADLHRHMQGQHPEYATTDS